ncbi:hypothetical protein Rmf_42940 [Roseomonas fluvialis]|uniref:Uncharacterized protein n=1 Tax=Roseomonas fluvialis TaxID=1750527 RepID=A0ABM7Y8N5_9PROT|nr:hypothetical protein Rmf_42940 [Roseomonas fluvialis]
MADRRPDWLAADHALRTHAAHQARHSASRQVMAFAVQLPPDLAQAVDAEVLLKHARALRHQRSIALHPCRPLGRIPPPGRLRALGRPGDRQDLADRLDPVRPAMIIEKPIMA